VREGKKGKGTDWIENKEGRFRKSDLRGGLVVGGGVGGSVDFGTKSGDRGQLISRKN